MRITDIHVDGFGVWHDMPIRRLSREVTVFYGLNEAGKTTLMHFLRSMLYGISAERRQAYLPPLEGGRPGGSLSIDTEDGPMQVNRFAERGPRDPGRVTVELPDGTTQGDRLLREAIEHVDEETFNNVFALGLDEIQELGTLSGTEAAQCIYRLTSGLDRISLYDVIQGLRASRRSIVGGGEKASELEDLLAQREILNSELAELSGSTRKWSQLAIESSDLQTESTELREELRQSQQAARRVELAMNVRPHWLQRNELRSELKRYDNLYQLEDDAIEQLDELNERIEEHERQRDVLKGQRHQLREEADELGINEVLCRQGCRVEALGEQQEWLESLAEQAEAFEAEATQLETQLNAERDRLAEQWLGDANRRLELTVSQVDQLKPQQEKLQSAERQLAETQEAVESFRGEEDKYRTQLESAMHSNEQLGLPTDLHEAGDLVAKLRRRLQVEQRIEQSRRSAVDLQEQAHQTMEEQVLPLGWYAVALASTVIGAMCLTASYWISGSNYFPAGLMLVGFGVAVPMYRWFAEQNAADRLDDCHRQLAQLEKQLSESREERELLDADLPLTEGSVVLRLQTAEKHLAELEDMLPVETQRRQATEASRTATRELESARQQMAAAKKGWESQLKALGLPTGLAPSEVKLLAGKYEQIAELEARADNRREDVVRRQKEFQRVVNRIESLAEESQLVLEDASPLEQLDYLLEQSRLQKAHLAHRDKLRDRAKELKHNEGRHARAAIGLSRQREARFDTAGVEDEQAYRRLADNLAEAARIHSEIDDLTRQIAVAIGAGRQEDDFADLMAPAAVHTLEKVWEEMTAEHEQLEAKIADLARRCGAIETQQQALVDDHRLADCKIELGQVEAQIAAAEEAWRERAVVSLVLEHIRHDYEQHRQPETLREASEYFQRLTGGQYTRVWTPLANDILLVDRADGDSIGVDSLSRGTREQLFLSVRLALVAMYARRGIQLPMVLDDVLVNYDEQRATRAAEVMVEFAREGHQLLVFTCHEHIWKIFRSLNADVRRLPSRFGEAEPVEIEEVVEEAIEAEVVETPTIEPAKIEPVPLDDDLEEVVPYEAPAEPVEFEYLSDIPERERAVEFEYTNGIPPREKETVAQTVVEYDWSHDDYGDSWISNPSRIARATTGSPVPVVTERSEATVDTPRQATAEA